MRKLLILIVLWLSLLKAGDPCPIGYNFYDAGVPSWLDRSKILNELKSKKTWLGIAYNDIEGRVEITNVFKQSPAEKAGIKVGDTIYALADKKIKRMHEFSDYFDIERKEIKIKIKRKGKVIEKKITLGFRDPLLYALKEYIPEGCSDSQMKELSEKERQEIYKKVISPLKRFDCKTAHKKLQKMKLFTYNEGQLVLIRGSKRVLLIEPQWGTVCLNSRDYDGKNLTKTTIKKLFLKLFDKYTNDRFENP